MPASGPVPERRAYDAGAADCGCRTSKGAQERVPLGAPASQDVRWAPDRKGPCRRRRRVPWSLPALMVVRRLPVAQRGGPTARDKR
eukprot:15485637-Alexandrium_andersonii.AAC.1